MPSRDSERWTLGSVVFSARAASVVERVLSISLSIVPLDRTAARLNPLDDGPRPSGLDDASWQAQVRARRLGLLAALAEATLGRVLRATERTALDTALDTARCEDSTPVLPMVVDAMLEPEWPFAGSTVEELRSDGREVAHALARLVRGDLAGRFDGPSTVRFDPGLPMLSLDLSAISGSDTLIGLVMTCAST